MRILVTGASGFVGRNIVKAAERASHEVIAAGGPRTGEKGLAVHVADKNDVARIAPYGPFDAVIHSAGIAHRAANTTDDEYHRVNAIGCGNVADLAAASGARHFVLIGSVLVYGRKDRDPRHCVSENDDCRPDDAYAKSKLDGERQTADVCGSAGVGLTILRLAPVIGEEGRGNFDRLMRTIDSGRFIRVGAGRNPRSLVYVGDVADAAVRSANDNVTGIFNLAAQPITMKEVVDRIAERLGKSIPPVTVPEGVAKTSASLLGLLPPTRPLARTLDNWLATDVYCTDRAEAAGIGCKTTIYDAIDRAVAAYKNAR